MPGLIFIFKIDRLKVQLRNVVYKKIRSGFSEWYKPSCLSAWDYTGSYEDSVYVVQQLFTDRTIGYGQ